LLSKNIIILNLFDPYHSLTSTFLTLIISGMNYENTLMISDGKFTIFFLSAFESNLSNPRSALSGISFS